MPNDSVSTNRAKKLSSFKPPILANPFAFLTTAFIAVVLVGLVVGVVTLWPA